MKNLHFAFIVLFTLAMCPSVLNAQDLTWRGLELKAEYELLINGQESTENYDSMRYTGNSFDGGILSGTCGNSFKHSCIINTPQIAAMNDLAFAMPSRI